MVCCVTKNKKQTSHFCVLSCTGVARVITTVEYDLQAIIELSMTHLDGNTVDVTSSKK